MALISVSKSICTPVGRKELTVLEIAMSRSIVMGREALFPALSVAVRMNTLLPHTRLTLFDQLEDERREVELSVALAIPPRSKILPVMRAVEPVTCAPLL